MVKDAVPLVPRGRCARTVDPSRKVTMPAGNVDPGGTEATVAVKETGCPPLEGLGDEPSVVVDARA